MSVGVAVPLRLFHRCRIRGPGRPGGARDPTGALVASTSDAKRGPGPALTRSARRAKRDRSRRIRLRAMRRLILAPLLVSTLAAAVERRTGQRRPDSAHAFENPRIVDVRAPGGDLTIRARRGTAFVPGLGEVEGVYGYDVRRGDRFPGSKTVGLMPPVISVARGSTLGIRFRNELLSTDPAGKRQPTESNLHTHGLLVSPKGFETADRARAYGDCVFVLASASGSNAGHAHSGGNGSPAQAPGDPCSLDPGA